MNHQEWASEFCDRVFEQLAMDLTDVERRPDIPTRIPRFRSFWKNLAREIHKSSILVMLDEAPAIPETIRETFYSIIREIYTNRTAHNPVPELKRYNFIFAGSFSPGRLVQNQVNSPFNVSEICRLSDFTVDEVGIILSHLGNMAVHATSELDVLAHEVHRITGGHPLLTQRLAALLREALKKDNTIFINDGFVQEMLPILEENAEDNIRYVINRSLHTENRRSIVQRVLKGEQIDAVVGNEDIDDLRLYGALRLNEGRCVIRNLVYERALRRALLNPTIGSTIDQRECDNLSELISEAQDLKHDYELQLLNANDAGDKRVAKKKIDEYDKLITEYRERYNKLGCRE